jgi:hypothetical protein
MATDAHQAHVSGVERGRIAKLPDSLAQDLCQSAESLLVERACNLTVYSC